MFAAAILLLCVICFQQFFKISTISELLFKGDAYLEYRPIKSIFERDIINRIDLKFRTTHPSGVMVLMVGKYEKAALVLQLVQGKLRYGITHRSKDISQFIMGNNLNDDNWHMVKVIRTGRITEIILDREKKTLLSPMHFKTLTVNEVFYIGGYDHFKLRYLKNVVSIGSNYVGCLNIKQIDNRNPIMHYEKGNKQIPVVPLGPITFGCDRVIGQTFGFRKPTSKLAIDFLRNKNKTSIVVKLSFRTYNLHGGIFSTDTSMCDVKVSLKNGNVSLEVSNSNEKSILAKVQETAAMNDGEWHDVAFAVTGKDIFLLVDDGARITSTLSENVNCCEGLKTVSIGGSDRYSDKGFVGCVRNVVVNEEKVVEHKSEKYTLWKIDVDEKCVLNDKCYPNPCRNQGICLQDWKGYRCDCSRTSFFGLHCDVSIYHTSCAAYQELGLNETSYCLIHTDGTGDNTPYTTLCQFDSSKQAYTVIHHNKEDIFSATEGDETLFRYTFHQIKYETDMNRIEALIKKSKYCRQKVTFKCRNSALLNAPDGPPNVQWKSRSGDERSYWGGVTKNGKGCACGVNRTCMEKDKFCNCDSRYNNWSEDSGYLTEKFDLPVIRLSVAGIKNGFGYIIIGPLECFGSNAEESEKSEIPPNLLQRVCITTEEKRELVNDANTTKKNIIKITPHQPDHTTTPDILQVATIYPTDTPGNLTNFSYKPFTNSSSGSKSLSILELVLVSVAGVAVVILTVKFVLCNIFSKLHGQVILNHDIDRIKNDPSLLSASTTGMVSGKSKRKSPMSAYWV